MAVSFTLVNLKILPARYTAFIFSRLCPIFIIIIYFSALQISLTLLGKSCLTLFSVLYIYRAVMCLFLETIGYFVHITNSKSVVRENNVSAAVTKSFAMFSVGRRSFFREAFD